MARDPDYPEFDDLMGIDLDALDLQHIDLDDPPGSPWWRYVIALGLLGAVVGIIWLPTTDFYQHAGDWLFALLCIAATGVGLFGGRWLWQWAEEASLRWAQRRAAEASEPPKPPSAFARGVTLLLGLGGAAVLLFVVSPSDLGGAGTSGYSDLWYLTAAGAIGVGILLGRWLLMQEHNPFKNVRPVTITLPPWFKWVSLGVIVGGGVIIMVLQTLSGGSRAGEEGAGLGGAAFVLGIFAAVWIARRFDEAEARVKKNIPPKRPGSA